MRGSALVPGIVVLLLSALVFPASADHTRPAPEEEQGGSPWDHVLSATPAFGDTYRDVTFVGTLDDAPASVIVDLEDSTLVSTKYKVESVVKPAGCADPADRGAHGYKLPDHADILAPFQWPVEPLPCQTAGEWTVEVRGEAAPLSTGGLRLHVSTV